MPSLYQARCTHCGNASDILTDGYGAVWVDAPVTSPFPQVLAGASLTEETNGAEIEHNFDPNLVVLAHPAESTILASMGYTWWRLAWAGRFVQICRVICRQCGTQFKTRTLMCPPAIGCNVGCLTGLLTGVMAGLWLQSVWQGLGVGYGAMIGMWIVVSWVGRVYTRVRFRERAVRVNGPTACPNCQADDFANVGRGGVYPCLKCGEVSVRLKMVGKS